MLTTEAEKLIILEKIQSRSIELQLEEDLRKFFTDLGVWIQNRLHHYYNVNLNKGQLHLITDPILDKHQEYYEILEHWIRLQYALGEEEAESLLRFNRNRVAQKARIPKPKLNSNLENEFIKDFYTLISRAEGTQGIELKPIYNKLKRKYKKKVKNRKEFENLFTKAVMGTNTRLYPSRDVDMFVKIGGRNFGYIDRRNLQRPVLIESQEGDIEVVRREPPEPRTFVHRTGDINLKNKYNLFGTLTGAEDDLLERVFIASKGTLMKVNNNIKSIITDGYVNGEGINEVSLSLTRRFDQLRTWEAKRIARTETHNAHNNAVYNSYKEHDVQYTQWITVHDEKVRRYSRGDQADHVRLDGEIIRIGDTYSNGLRYPGDTNGPLAEYINCRCANAPYVIPYGFAAPPKATRFFENELIKI